MRVSHNEVYRTVQRALEGAGAPYGIDRDGALAVAWLEARGLPGLDLLTSALARMEGAFDPLDPPRRDGAAAVIDLSGRPAIAWAGTVVDCFDLVAGEGGALHLRGCRWPLHLLPLAAARAVRGRPLLLRWTIGRGSIACSAAASGGCRIVGENLAGGLRAAFRDGEAVEVVLTESGSTVRSRERGDPAEVIDGDALDRALQLTLAQGVPVDGDAWAAVAEAAKRVLVPASDVSRARGAGGGDANA